MSNHMNEVEDSCIKLFLVDDHLVLRQALSEAFAHRGTFQVVAEA